MPDYIVLFKKAGLPNASYTSNGIGVRVIRGAEVMIWYPNTGTIMQRTNVGQKKIGVSKEHKTVAEIIKAYGNS